MNTLENTNEVKEKWIIRVDKTIMDYYEVEVDDAYRKEYGGKVGENPADYGDTYVLLDSYAEDPFDSQTEYADISEISKGGN
tara:strand:+ start:219 stop:464 length:246 start_codon:yes stop_codon:yes gene_type:complete